MKTQNKVQLVGYLGKDPEIKIFEKGCKKARMRVATDTYYRKEGGEAIKRTVWHTIIVWNGMADLAEQHFCKGSHILVEGMIQYHVYTDKEGNLKYVTEIKANHFLNLDR